MTVNPEARRKFETKIRAVLYVSSTLLVIVSLWILDLEITRENEVAEKLEKGFGRVASIRIPLYRGSIKDSRGRELAISVPAISVFVHPDTSFLRNKEEFIKGLSRITGIPASRIENRIKEGVNKPVRIIRGIDINLRKKIQELILKTENSRFVGIQEEYIRHYPNGTTASNLLGFVGIDGIGLEGLEYALNEYLKGGFSHALIHTNGGLGRIYLHPLRGMLGEERDVILTVDLGIQNILERIRDEIVKKWKPSKVSIVLMDVRTGDILGLTTYPYYNPNRFQKYPPEKRRNYAITDLFEPGSIMKPFFIAWAYEKGYVSPSYTVNTGKGRIKVYDRYIRDYRSLGRINLKEIIVHSSNVGTVKVASLMSKKDVETLLESFHMHRKFGILPGEANPRIPNLNYPANILYISIGQGIAMNTLNAAVAFGALATGNIVKPRILKEIVSSDGRVVYRERVHLWKRQVLSPSTIRWIRKALIEVVERGTGKKARSRYFTIAGKTGTSQKFDIESGKYSRDKVVTYFAGFFPATDPKFVAVIVVDEPKGRRLYGGEVNAPYFRKLVEQVSFYYGLKPDKLKK